MKNGNELLYLCQGGLNQQKTLLRVKKNFCYTCIIDFTSVFLREFTVQNDHALFKILS